MRAYFHHKKNLIVLIAIEIVWVHAWYQLFIAECVMIIQRAQIMHVRRMFVITWALFIFAETRYP